MTQKVTFTPTTWNEGIAPGISAAEKNRIESGVNDLVTAWNAREHVQWFSYPTGSVAVETGTHRVYAREDRTIAHIQCFVSTAPTGASIKADVHKNGTTIFTTQTNQPTIAIGAFSSSTTAPDDVAWDAGDYLTVDIDQIGSTIAGAGFTLRIVYTKD